MLGISRRCFANFSLKINIDAKYNSAWAFLAGDADPFYLGKRMVLCHIFRFQIFHTA